MAELILATVGLAVTIPGVASSFQQCGTHMKKLADRFKNAPSAVRAIGAFGLDLHRGKLQMDVEIAEWAFLQNDIHPHVKDGLEDCLAELRIALMEAAATLESFFDEKGQLRRTYYAFRGERRAERSLDNLRKWQKNFDEIVDSIDKKRRLVPNNLALHRNRLQVIHKPDGQDYTLIDGSRHFIAECEYSDNGVHTIWVLMEQTTMLEELNPEEKTEVVSTLASRLCTNRANQGILRCLGYRERKTPELIFELPKGLRSVQTLATTMTIPQTLATGGYPLEARLSLAHELCNAILCVHTSGLVHKNLRPSTVLLIQRESDAPNAMGSAYLTDWFMLRKDTELSSRRGSDNWMEDFYRHPRRQGRQPEERYNMGHDIYSLGVLLLEICLWEPFVQPWRTPPVSQLYETRADDLGIVSNTDSTVVKKLTKPLNIYQVLNSIAETEVAPRMGTQLATFILTCLQCLYGNVDGLNEADFKKSSTTAAMRFREMVSNTF
ncbi:MAG: hypothetical protein L6R41_001742 [Letrouitia leprolyta]|nr:MAG: hypothetical protein L6R41_001742 [Letrouitia leprolyta]